MVVECPKCKRRYEVDASQVPSGGGPVRCPSCENIFTIYREPLAIELIPVEREVETASPQVEIGVPTAEPTVTVETPPGVEVAPPGPEVEVVAAAREEAPSRIEVAPSHPPEIEVPVAPPEPAEVAPELGDRRERAKRLARSLVKDISLYHGAKVEQGLMEGRLAELLGEEIRKSWKYYREQVTKDILDTTNYFKDALNEILCKGRKIFT